MNSSPTNNFKDTRGLKDKTVIVCGGEGSTGVKVVQLLKRSGVETIVLDNRSSLAQKSGVERPINLCDTLEVQERFNEIKSIYPKGIDGCVCLITPSVFEFLEDLSLLSFSKCINNIQKSFNETFWSVYNPMVATAALNKDKFLNYENGEKSSDAKDCHIIIGSSVNAVIAGTCCGYDGGKSALIPEVANVNRKFGRYGIYCYQLLLGTISDSSNWNSEGGQRFLEYVKKDIPDGKLITTDDIALMIARILAGELKMLSGSPIYCDKSWLMTRGG